MDTIEDTMRAVRRDDDILILVENAPQAELNLARSLNTATTCGFGDRDFSFYLKWSHSYSTANISNLDLLSSFTPKYWGLCSSASKGHIIPYSDQLLQHMENICDDSEAVRLNFIHNSFFTKRYRSLEEIDPFAEAIKCRYVRKSFNDSIWANSNSIDWIDPLETDRTIMPEVMSELLDDSLLFAKDYIDYHGLPDFFFNDLTKLHFDFNLIECHTDFCYIVNSSDSQIYLELALLPANFYLHSIGADITFLEDIQYFRAVGLPLTHYPVYPI